MSMVICESELEKPMTDDEVRYWLEGRMAYTRWVPLTANPYGEGSIAYAWWRTGWFKADFAQSQLRAAAMNGYERR